MGYDGVELPIFDMDVAQFARLGKKLDEIGLERTAVTICTETENPISSDSAIRNAGLSRLKNAIDCCQVAGVKLLCGPMHSALGFFTGQGRTVNEVARAKEILVKAADYAQQAEVVLALEAVNRFECYFYNSVPDLAAFCREVKHPNLKTMYDTFHANIEEKKPADAIQFAKDQIVHVHISENDRSTPGKGQVNWRETFWALRQIDYHGWMTVEAFGLALPELAAATKIWRRMFLNEMQLATNALKFMKASWER